MFRESVLELVIVGFNFLCLVLITEMFAGKWDEGGIISAMKSPLLFLFLNNRKDYLSRCRSIRVHFARTIIVMKTWSSSQNQDSRLKRREAVRSASLYKIPFLSFWPRRATLSQVYCAVSEFNGYAWYFSHPESEIRRYGISWGIATNIHPLVRRWYACPWYIP